MKKYIDDSFTEAEFNWNLVRLYKALAVAKGEHLTPVEKLHLRGILCGYSPAEIAQQLHKNIKGVEVDLSKTIYQYVKILMNKSESEEVNNWRNISEWLEQAGYKIPSGLPSQQSAPPSQQTPQQSSQQPTQHIDIHAHGKAQVVNTVYNRGNLVIDFKGQIDFRGRLMVPWPKGKNDEDDEAKKSD